MNIVMSDVTLRSHRIIRPLTYWLWSSVIVLIIGLFATNTLVAQCTNGTQDLCKCTTAPVLCTIDELDSYSFSMSSFQHPQDGPTPLCPPPWGIGSVANNPTWFAFVAWCTSLTLLVHVENCTPFQGNINGVQIAIYSDCNYTAVACNTAPADCNTNDKTLTMNNLIIGNTYYFMIDGCAGAYCDVFIDVVGTCGEATIEEWTETVEGPTEICAGSSETHSVESLNGATHYHWYINGVLVDEGLEMTNFSQVWNTAGTYEICIDASNDPCIPEANPPDPNCLIVTVYDANAGTIQATPTPVCPNDNVTITAMGFNSDPGYTQYIVIANASGTIVEVISGSSTVFTHDECASFTAYSYNLHGASENDPPQVGDNVSSIACGDGCCDSDMAPFEFIDNIDPVLLNIPADLTLSCYDALPPMPSLNWTDNCAGSGMVPGDENGIADQCDGGVLTREWEYADECGNTVQAVQMIVINAMPEASFVNPPADITVNCVNIPSSAPALIAMNSGTGGCAISAMVMPVQNGTADECGGSFSFTWEYTDICNRTITHTQNVTVTPLVAPMFDMIPVDMTVSCSDAPTSAPDLTYSNGDTGPCAITGSVPAVMISTFNACGGNVRFQWVFTDQCDRTITANQNIVVEPAPEAMFINPPADITMTCNAIPSSIPALDYTNGESGDCLISGSVTPSINNNVNACGGSITSTWSFTDPCGRSQTHTQVITVIPAAMPVWINPPSDTTIECSMLPTSIPDLSYSNGESGICAIMGSVPGVQTMFDVCQGLVVWQWQFTDLCGNTITHTRNITTNPPPPVVFNNPPADITVACINVPNTTPSLTYTNNSGGACLVAGTVAGSVSGTWDLCGGSIVRTWEVTDPCGVVYSVSQTITVLPAPPSMFLNPPADVTLECAAVPDPAPNLQYSNGMPQGPCAQVGSVTPTVTGSYNSCGGFLTYTWQIADFCGNPLFHTQNVTVLPAPIATFDTDTIPDVNPISCNGAAAIPLELPFSNGASGLCAFEGVATATVTGEIEPCGGTLFFEWSVIDSCGNNITFTHSVDYLPAAAPQWVDPPGNDTLLCDEPYLPPDDLLLTNELTNECEHTVWVSPEVTFENNVHTHTWTYISCNNEVIEYVQYVLDYPEVDIDIDPENVSVCYGQVFDLASILVTEAGGQDVTITYHTSSPATIGNQLGSSMWTVLDDEDFVLLARNSFGCTDEAVVEISVLPLANAGDDEQQAICTTEGAIDFTDYLSFDADPGGDWIDVDGAGVLLDNPSNVSFAFVDPGTYHFQYVVTINECPADTSVLTIILSGAPEFTIDSVYCTDANMAYTVVIVGENLGISVSHGTVVTIPGGLMIEGIPIDQQLTFDIWDLDLFCVTSFSVNAPNCDCPQVPPPTNLGDVQICFGDPNPALEVSVGTGLAAHWYTVPAGGAPVASNTTSYVPTQTQPGIYTYYVESESLEIPGCVSTVRTPVIFTISLLPNVNNVNLDFCDTAETGILNIDLYNWASSITSNLQNTITFHSSMSDADAGLNALPMPVSVFIGSTDFFARVVDQNGCHAVAIVQIVLHALPVFGLQITDEICPGDNNGSVLLTGLDLSQQYTMNFNGNVFTNTFLFTGLAPGQYPLTVTSTTTGCSKDTSVNIGQGVAPEIAYTALTCNDNGTDTDPSDDYYTIDVVVNYSMVTMTYELFANGISQGYHAYGQIASFQLPANNSPVTLVAIDTLLGCSDTLTTAALNTCSSNCEITIDVLTQACSDNGTPVDPADDFHTITVTASAVNGSASNQYAVYFNGVLTYLFTYGIAESFTLPVSGPLPAIVLQDVSDPQCFLNLALDPLISCSNQCVIPLPDVQYTCDNQGTLDDPSDDTYEIIFTVSITNPGPSGMAIILVDGVVVQTVPNGAVVTLTLPAEGLTHLIEINDQDQSTCAVQWSTITLTPCSTLCIISVNSTSVDCNDNGTPLIPGDDFYEITWNATAVFGASSLVYDIVVDGSITGTGVYGIDQSLMLPADGGVHTLVLQDSDDANCSTQIILSALIHCSNACTLTADVIEIYCNNNGTNQTEADDIFYIVVDVTGINIPSGSWSVASQSISGSLGVQDTLGPYLISGGTQNIVFEAVGGSCSDAVAAVAPPPCSMCEQTVDAGPDRTLDCGTPTVSLTVTASHPGSPSWTDPGGGVTQAATINVSIAGQYIGTFSFPDGCVFSDTVIVTADPTLPSVWGGLDQYLNCEVREVLLESEVLVGSGSVTYEWTNQAGAVLATTSSILITQPGVYFIRIYDPVVDCWSGKDEVAVFDISNEPSAVIYADPGNIISCVIGSIVLSHDDEANVQYTWISQGLSYTNVTLTIFEEGTVTLIALDTITKCENKDSIVIEGLIDYPFIQIDPPGTLSCGNITVVLDATSSIPSTGGNYIWTDQAGDTVGIASTLPVQNEGIYILELNDPANGCVSFDTVSVIDISEYPELTPGEDLILPCAVNGGTLTALLAAPLPGVGYEWSALNGQIVGNVNAAQITFNGAGTYVVTATHTLSQCTDADTILVSNITNTPQALLSQLTPANCDDVDDGMIVLGTVQGGTPPYTFYVNGIETSSDTLSDLAPGAYMIEVEDANGCVLDTILTILTGEEVMVDLEAQVIIRIGEDHLLMAGVNIPPSEISSVIWTPATYLSCDTCLNTQAMPEENITYTIVVTDIYGCVGTATVNIRVIDENQIFIPNVISPSNNDNINDYFTVFSNKQGTHIHTLRIFDRWGAVVFEKFDFAPNIPSEGWNGTFNGEPLNPAVFVYMVEIETLPGIIEIFKGDVTIVR